MYVILNILDILTFVVIPKLRKTGCFDDFPTRKRVKFSFQNTLASYYILK